MSILFFDLPKLLTPVQTLPTSALENKVLSTIVPENVDRQESMWETSYIGLR